jgi:hypothetical protein
VTPRLDAAVDRALAKDPARRFPSMAAFAQELRACLTEAEGALPAQDDLAMTVVTPPPAHRPPPARPRRASRSRRRPWVYVLLALVLAGAAFAAVALLGGGSHHGGSGGSRSSGKPVQLHGLAGYDPQGDGVEGNDVAGDATDGSTLTSWSTETYRGPDFAGLKSGVGLVLAAGGLVKLAHLTVMTPTPGFTAEIQAGDSPSGGFTADSSPQRINGTTTFTLDGKAANYYVIWITKPSVDRIEISEVKATS